MFNDDFYLINGFSESNCSINEHLLATISIAIGIAGTDFFAGNHIDSNKIICKIEMFQFFFVKGDTWFSFKNRQL